MKIVLKKPFKTIECKPTSEQNLTKPAEALYAEKILNNKNHEYHPSPQSTHAHKNFSRLSNNAMRGH